MKITEQQLEQIIESKIIQKLAEGRLENVEYRMEEAKNKTKKVIAVLKAQKAGAANKTIEKYEKIYFLMAKLEKLKKELDPEVKEYFSNYFDKEDEFFTRIIETNRLLIQLSKDSERKTFDIDVFLKKLEESGLSEDILTNIKTLINASYKISKVAPSLKSKPKDMKSEVINEDNLIQKIYTKIKSIVGNLLSKFNFTQKDINKKTIELFKFGKKLRTGQIK